MTDLRYKPKTILAWVREFRKLDGYLKRDGRGLHERGWIMSEEDLVLKLMKWLKNLKRVSVKKVREYINNVLLAREGGNLRNSSIDSKAPLIRRGRNGRNW